MIWDVRKRQADGRTSKPVLPFGGLCLGAVCGISAKGTMRTPVMQVQQP